MTFLKQGSASAGFSAYIWNLLKAQVAKSLCDRPLGLYHGVQCLPLYIHTYFFFDLFWLFIDNALGSVCGGGPWKGVKV